MGNLRDKYTDEELDDIGERAKAAEKEYPSGSFGYKDTLQEAFIKGAKWGKENPF